MKPVFAAARSEWAMTDHMAAAQEARSYLAPTPEG